MKRFIVYIILWAIALFMDFYMLHIKYINDQTFGKALIVLLGINLIVYFIVDYKVHNY